VLAEASCSRMSAEVCVTLGHEVGPAPAITKRALCIVSNPYVSILRAISNVIACGGFFPPSSRKEVFFMPGGANSVGLRSYGFFLLHLWKEVFYAIVFNKYLIILKSIEGVCHFMPSIVRLIIKMYFGIHFKTLCPTYMLNKLSYEML
jgi:hypothetical protein